MTDLHAAANTPGVAFRLFGTSVGVATPDTEIAALVARLLSPYATSLGPVDELWRLEQRDGQWWVESELASPDTFPTLPEALEALEYLITLRLLQHSDRIAHLHAGGVVRDGEAVLVLGDSGAGKTSMAFHWSLSGLPVLSDDIVFIDHQAHAIPFKRLFSVDPSRFRVVGRTPDAALQLGATDENLWFDPASCGAWAEPAPVGTVALIRFDPGVDLTVEPLSTAETLSLLLASLMDGGIAPEVAIDRLATLARRARTLRVTFNDSAAAAAALAKP